MQKILITYLGGSGGDLLAGSLNNTHMDVIDNIPSNRHLYSIKYYENDIISKKKNLKELLLSYKTKFISTHLYTELEHAPNHKISLLSSVEKIQEKIILRQMQLQNLEIEIKHEQKNFCILLSLCKKKLFKKAAVFWFEFSRQIWKEKMKTRLKKQLDNSTIIYIDEIFTTYFYNSIKEQKISFDLGTLKENHHRWLKENDQFDYKKTISAIELKLSAMDWTQQEGIIKYSQLEKL